MATDKTLSTRPQALPGSTSTGALPGVDPDRYAIHGELAHGGIGRILRARDLHLGRPVAIKEMLRPSRDAEARFVAEALVTARLQHPSIVPVYEAGRWPGGDPFYAMKLVSGRSLADVIAEKQSLEERLALLPHVLAVAEAIAYAHTERIIHRDLKPANVLVGAFGETVVIDWGLAKDLAAGAEAEAAGAPGPEATVDGGLTRVGAIIGTPVYMPPEQAAGQPVDERADVYALGAILYHLLAGSRPYEAPSSEEVLQQVVEGPPAPLSQRQKGIPPDLLAIVAKAMARDPAGRYATARELAEDLRRFQTGQIVGAHQYSWVELLRRFGRRYRAALAVTGVALVLLATGGAVSVRHILAERDVAEQARQDAEDARQRALEQTDALLLLQARGALEKDPNEAVAWLRRLSPGFTQWSAVRTLAADAQSHGFASVLSGHTASVNDLVFTPDGRSVFTASDDGTIGSWNLERGERHVLTGHTDEVWHVFLTADGQLLSSSKDGTVRLWDLETRESRVLVTLPGPIEGLGLSADRRRFAAASWGGDEVVWWDLDTGDTQTLHSGLKGVQEMELSPDGRYVLLRPASGGGVAMLGDLERGTFERLEHGEKAFGIQFSPDSRLAVWAHVPKALWARELESGRYRQLGQDVGVIAELAFSPDGTSLAAAALDGSIWLWEHATGQPRKLGSHEGRVNVLVFSPDGRHLASGGNDRTTRLWEVATGYVRTLRGASQVVISLAFSSEGRWLATGSSDGTVRLFNVLAEPSHVVLSAPPFGPLLPKAIPQALKVSSDGQRLVTSHKGTLRLIGLGAGTQPLWEEQGCTPGGAEFSRDGRWLAAACKGQVRVWEGTTGQEKWTLEGHGADVAAVAFSRDGRWLGSADQGGGVYLWDLASGQGRRLDGHAPHGVTLLTFSPDGGRLAVGSKDKTVRVWEVASGSVQVLRGHEGLVTGLAFSPDGQRLVSASDDHTLRFWDLESGQGRRVDVSGGGVTKLVLSPDGKLLAHASYKDVRVHLWDMATGASRGVLVGHKEDVFDMAFSPDSTRLATASEDKTVRLWDMASRESRVLRGHKSPVTDVVFLPDGRSLLSMSTDGALRQWPDDLPTEPEALRAWLEQVSVNTSLSLPRSP
jgi:WD40 repeat protein/tRNA A-37 threonylcarbamoyl transferase component Bud32